MSMTGAEELRAVVNWIDWQDEGFLDRFSSSDLVRLWRYGRDHESEVNEFADSWSDEQIAAALGR